MNTIDKIRAEIERRFWDYGTPLHDDVVTAKVDEILSFLDTLEEPENEDLEEAAEKYAENNTEEEYHTDEGIIQTYGIAYDAFKAGAEWQEKQDLGWAGEIHKNGYNLCKEQMMKGAVEGEVCGRVYDHINVRFADGVCKYLEPKNISHIPADVSKYNIGDKVRIIVVKEEEQ